MTIFKAFKSVNCVLYYHRLLCNVTPIAHADYLSLIFMT